MDFRDRIMIAAAGRFLTIPQIDQSPPVIATMEELAPEEAARFSRAYHTLQITVGNETSAAAHGCTSQLWDMARAATAGTETRYLAADAAGKQLRRALRQAMRVDLGVPD